MASTTTDSSLKLAYIGAGCNMSAHIMDWCFNNLICFGVCNSVSIYDPNIGKIIGNLIGHTDKLTCVKWIKGSNIDKSELISGSADSKVLVWSLDVKKGLEIKSCFELIGHSGTILDVDGVCRKHCSETIIASAASDNTVRIWLKKSGDNSFSSLKSVSSVSSFPLCLNMALLPTSTILLAIGTDTPELHLYSIGQSEPDVTYLTKTIGHEDWIRSIDIAVIDDEEILIASSSQDMMVRISRLSKKNNDVSSDAFSLKKEEIDLDSSLYFISLETVLFGHEGWVYSVHWSPNLKSEGISLLTASFDRTLIIWRPCPDSGVWLEETRMGEMGGDNTLGYYGAKFSPDGLSVLAHSYQGSFHLWKKQGDKWIADFIISGHSDTVTDISWEKNGRFLISVSSDKTSRLHAPCIKGVSSKSTPWCELSRPQIHGHALYSVTTLSNLNFASCSEEKVIRVFTPSFSVLKLLNYFCDSVFQKEKESWNDSLPSSASITALGLSNKANFEEKDNSDNNENGLDSDITPNEDFLAQNTLWPEVMKLYGHGNDVFSVACSHDGRILASASKATTSDQAKIILWNTSTWNQICTLQGHQLTITQMEFSPDDNYLLSVSRDRKWCLFQKSNSDEYSLIATAQKHKIMHSRIIWSCSWSHDGLYFVTGSRDCKVIIWDKEMPVANMISEHGSVTAVNFGPVSVGKGNYLLAIGHDSGEIVIFNWSLDGWSFLHAVPPEIGHNLTVHRLRFRPLAGRTGEPSECNNILQLASCSADYSVRVFDITIDTS